MKRIITLGAVSILSSFILVGCGGATPSASNPGWLEIHKELSQKKIGHIIKTAGERAGWRMTEFKRDAILADKTDGDDIISTTVYFTKDSFTTNPKNDDLEDAIADALN